MVLFVTFVLLTFTIHRYDAISDQIEVANDAVLRAQGIANEGMKSWYEIKLAEQKAAISSLQTGRKMVRR